MLKPGEFKEADRICSAALDRNLSDWDERFINDVADRLDEFGVLAHITERQWEQLHRIERQYL